MKTTVGLARVEGFVTLIKETKESFGSFAFIDSMLFESKVIVVFLARPAEKLGSRMLIRNIVQFSGLHVFCQKDDEISMLLFLKFILKPYIDADSLI